MTTLDVEWMRQGNCRNHSFEKFIPPDWPTNDDEEAAELDAAWYAASDGGQAAVAICFGCPVRVECFDMSLSCETTLTNGVWGGTTPQDRYHFLETLSVRG